MASTNKVQYVYLRDTPRYNRQDAIDHAGELGVGLAVVGVDKDTIKVDYDNVNFFTKEELPIALKEAYVTYIDFFLSHKEIAALSKTHTVFPTDEQPHFL